MADISELMRQRAALDLQIQEEVSNARSSGETITIDGREFTSFIDFEGKLSTPEEKDWIPLYRKDSNGDIILPGEITIEDLVAAFCAEASSLLAQAIKAGETAVGNINNAGTAALDSIGRDDSSGARGAAISSLQAKLTAALDAIGRTNDEGARKAAIEAINSALNSALSQIGQTDGEGARKAALDAISAALTSAKTEISSAKTAGVDAIGTAKNEALAVIGTDNNTGARKAAIDAINALTEAFNTKVAQDNTAWDTKVQADNTALDQKIALANTTIDEKVSSASGSAAAASENAALAAKWASNPEDAVVADGKYSALHYMLKAQEILEQVTAATMIAPPYPNLEVSYPQQGGDTAIVTMTNNYAGYAGITLRYRTDGQDPTASDPVFTSPQAITVNGTIMVRAFQSGADSKPSPSNSILVQGLQVQTPSYSYNTQTKQLVLSCATTGATIRYTTDGSAPTEASSAHSGAIAISATTNFRMRAFKANVIASEEVSFSVVLLPTPVITATRNADNTTCTLTLTNTAAYTALGITALHIKSDSPALDYTINPATTGVLVSNWPCADYKSLSFYAHADGDVSDSAVMPVSVPQAVLPAPTLSISRTGATTATVTVTNTASFPSSGCSLVVNGSSYSFPTANITITMAATAITAYAAYSGTLSIASTSTSQSGTVKQYKLPTPDIKIIDNGTSSGLINIIINCENLSEYPNGTVFAVTVTRKGSASSNFESLTLSINDFPKYYDHTTLLLRSVKVDAIASLAGAADSDEGSDTFEY